MAITIIYHEPPRIHHPGPTIGDWQKPTHPSHPPGQNPWSEQSPCISSRFRYSLFKNLEKSNNNHPITLSMKYTMIFHLPCWVRKSLPFYLVSKHLQNNPLTQPKGHEICFSRQYLLQKIQKFKVAIVSMWVCECLFWRVCVTICSHSTHSLHAIATDTEVSLSLRIVQHATHGMNRIFADRHFPIVHVAIFSPFM